MRQQLTTLLLGHGLTLFWVGTGLSGLMASAPAQAFPNLLRDWQRFSSYPHLARGAKALQQRRFAEAEREARHVLNKIDANSREARLLLAEALLAQRRFGTALDALAPLPREPLRREIQNSWLNQPNPAPTNRVERWLQQARSKQDRDALATAYAALRGG